MIWAATVLFFLLMFAVTRVDWLDVETGARDSFGYGSNRGWHWPWTPLIQVCFFGVIFCVLKSA